MNVNGVVFDMKYILMHQEFQKLIISQILDGSRDDKKYFFSIARTKFQTNGLYVTYNSLGILGMYFWTLKRRLEWETLK